MVDQCSAVLMPQLDRTIFGILPSILSFISLLPCWWLQALNNWLQGDQRQRRSAVVCYPYADIMCEYLHWFVSHLWRKKLLGELGAIWRIDVFINTKHQGIKKHDIPDSWTNAELKHLGSSQLSNWNALTKNN